MGKMARIVYMTCGCGFGNERRAFKLIATLEQASVTLITKRRLDHAGRAVEPSYLRAGSGRMVRGSCYQDVPDSTGTRPQKLFEIAPDDLSSVLVGLDHAVVSDIDHKWYDVELLHLA